MLTFSSIKGGTAYAYVEAPVDTESFVNQQRPVFRTGPCTIPFGLEYDKITVATDKSTYDLLEQLEQEVADHFKDYKFMTTLKEEYHDLKNLCTKMHLCTSKGTVTSLIYSDAVIPIRFSTIPRTTVVHLDFMIRNVWFKNGYCGVYWLVTKGRI